jgi:hypothetical protein
MLLKSVKEFIENVLFSFLSASHVGVLSCIVNTLQILNIDDATAITVEFCESEQNRRFPAVIHFSNDRSQEIIIVDCSTAITVEESKNSLNLTLFCGDSVVLHGLCKLSEVKCL